MSNDVIKLPWYEEILSAERRNPDYNKRDIHTYTQEPLCSTPTPDVEAHMCAAPNSGCVTHGGTQGRSISGNFDDKTTDQATNAVLKFSTPKGYVSIATKKLPSVYTPFIVERYKMYQRNEFTASSLIHHQQVKYFYSTQTRQFHVCLPDHFYDSLDLAVLNRPKFDYETEDELLKQYPKDLKAFAEEYFTVFARYREGQKVIMVYSSRENGGSAFYGSDRIKSDDAFDQSTMDFGSKMQIARGVLYGRLFYQVDNKGTIQTKHSQTLTKESDNGYITKDRNILYCIPDEPGQWEQLVAIIQAFKTAQAALDGILTESRDMNSIVGKTISLPSLEQTLRQHLLPKIDDDE